MIAPPSNYRGDPTLSGLVCANCYNEAYEANRTAKTHVFHRRIP